MKNKKKGFTLVELLAVIVILAVILVIAIPQIMNTIKTARLSSIKDSAMLIAQQAEKDYLSQQVLNQDYNETSIPCTDVAKLNNDYSFCNISFDDNGKTVVKLLGKEKGKFSKIRCNGTKDDMECDEIPDGYYDAVEHLTVLYNGGENNEGLIMDEFGNLRYHGSNSEVNNYVILNGNERWRIVGIFDVSNGNIVERRIKLTGPGLGVVSWDTSDSTINDGNGINEWTQSDIMREMNSDYLDTSLTENLNWYNGKNDSIGNKNFNKNRILKEETQMLIDNAVWYLGAANGKTAAERYKNERGIGELGFVHVNNPADGIERKNTWLGKVGIMYPSDIEYARGSNESWLYFGGWLCSISPASNNPSSIYCYVYGGNISTRYAFNTGVAPSVYLKSNVLLKGEGTSSNPYIFSM